MVSIVSPGVTHVSTEYATDLTEGINMVVLKFNGNRCNLRGITTLLKGMDLSYLQ